MTHEGEGKTAEVATATEAGNHLIGIFLCHGHLLLCLKTYNRLVERHMVENGTKRVLTVGRGGGQLHSL